MVHPRDTTEAKSSFDGRDLTAMVSAATRLLEANVDGINALNVFPVPDGDTGTNMFLTMSEVTRWAESVESASAGDVAAAIARGAVEEARGNSGIILSQFFEGIASELEGKESFGGADLAAALWSASDRAYTAVGEPVEGTLLTVIRSVAEVAGKRADSGDGPGEILEAAAQAAKEAVALTPTLLPILSQAGVVDAGGQGLAVMLEGIRQYVGGGAIVPREIPPPEALGVEAGAGTVSMEFLEAADEEVYGYCTQFVIRGAGLKPDGLRQTMTSVAQSAVVVGNETTVKVHVHALDPGPVISLAVSLGTLAQVKIDNMDEQRREYSKARRQEAMQTAAASGAESVAVVAVVWGEGLEALFDELGADGVLPAGDTMNPSVRQILDVVERTSSRDVIFLPNNRNIVPAARRAVEMTEKRVRVVPATTIPQGVAAMLAFNAEMSLEHNVAEMESTLDSVRTGEVCDAARPVLLNGVSVDQGQVIGLLDRELVVAGDEPAEVLVALLRSAGVSNGDLVTLYWGGRLTEGDAERARTHVEQAFPAAEVEVVPGGQPHYHYIASIE